MISILAPNAGASLVVVSAIQESSLRVRDFSTPHFSISSLLHILLTQHLKPSPELWKSINMGDEVKIDKNNFNDRLSHFTSQWRNDNKRGNDGLFGGVGSIVVLMGKNEEIPSFKQNNAMHHWLLQYEVPIIPLISS